MKKIWKIAVYILVILGGVIAFMALMLLFEYIGMPKDSKGSNKLHKERLTLLKEAGAYEVNTEEFPILSFDTTGLYKVREYFMLDTLIDGIEGGWEKALKIEKWLHNNIAHDGSISYEGDRNAIDIWEFAKQNGKGVNGGILAVALNELYLSVGLRSRYIYCLPGDKNDIDCDIINEVWIDDLNKWVGIDPSNHAYLTNSDGELLSIKEVREYVIEDKELLLNDDANRNGEKRSLDSYLQRMARTLYRFERSSIYGYNVGTNGSPIHKLRQNIILVPKDYIPSNTQDNDLITNDDNYFWE